MTVKSNEKVYKRLSFKSMTNSPPQSPKRHKHIDEKKQSKLDEETEKYLEEIGSPYHFQAFFHAEVARDALNSEAPILQELKPDIKDLKRTAWKKAFYLSLAVLKRYKMKLTIDTIKNEYNSVPKSTGYTHGRDVDEYFSQLFHVSEELSKVSFDERSNEFAKSFEQENANDDSNIRSNSGSISGIQDVPQTTRPTRTVLEYNSHTRKSKTPTS